MSTLLALALLFAAPAQSIPQVQADVLAAEDRAKQGDFALAAETLDRALAAETNSGPPSGLGNATTYSPATNGKRDNDIMSLLARRWPSAERNSCKKSA